MIGEYMRRRREALGWSQVELAMRTGRTQTYVSKVERGEIGLPQRSTLGVFAKALGVTVTDFYEAAGVAQVPQGLEDSSEESVLAEIVAWVETDATLEEQLGALRDRIEPTVYQSVIRRLAKAWANSLKGLVDLLEPSPGYSTGEGNVSAVTAEQAFEDAMLGIYEQAKRKCKYNATRFLQMIRRHGGVATAKRLLQTSSVEVSPGLQKLWECGHLDISMEALVQQDAWQSLFTAEELAVAKARLDQLDYQAQ
jgi:transcriptional regulator with XRE-family HTH domain